MYAHSSGCQRSINMIPSVSRNIEGQKQAVHMEEETTKGNGCIIPGEEWTTGTPDSAGGEEWMPGAQEICPGRYTSSYQVQYAWSYLGTQRHIMGLQDESLSCLGCNKGAAAFLNHGQYWWLSEVSRRSTARVGYVGYSYGTRTWEEYLLKGCHLQKNGAIPSIFHQNR